MKKNSVFHLFDFKTEHSNGERYSTILGYFFPEFVTSFVLYSLPFLIEALFISHLKSTPIYATLGASNLLLHLLIKMAEAFAIGTVIVTGNFNGLHAYHDVGRTVRDAFWLTFLLGLILSTGLSLGAYWIYYWYGVPQEMINLGIPFLRLRAIGIFFTFVYFAFIGFLRGIKNTKTPMRFFVIGALVFIFFDYVLIFGKWGFPQLGLQGSAWAGVIQYATMCLLAFIYILSNKQYRKYSIDLLTIFTDKSYFTDLMRLSWPVILDKTTLAMSYIWLCKMIAPMGTQVLAGYSFIKDIERFSFLPAIALAQIITFLVSNDYSIKQWDAIKINIKKVLALASIMVFSILCLISFWMKYIIIFFDRSNAFTNLVMYSFPILSVLVFFDLLQLILSGGLRGAGNVKTVMVVRLVVCFGYFFPVSYGISLWPIDNYVIKFVLLYGSFYIGNALMSIYYIIRFKGHAWKQAS